ncbi:TPA: carbohydrate ABC transporter permease [Vibrio cholerae]
MATINKERQFYGLVFTLPATIYMGIFLIYPLCLVFFDSFFFIDAMDPAFNEFIGTENYSKVLSSNRFWGTVGNTLMFTCLAVLLEFILGFLIALAITSLKFGQQLARTLFLLPLMIAPLVAAMAWRFIFSSEFGLLNWTLFHLGIIDNPSAIPWLNSPDLSLVSAIITDIWLTTPFIVLIMVAGLQSLPKDVTEAAYVDGVGWWKEVLHIKLPMLRPVIAVAVVMRMIDAARTFDIIWILTGGGPRFSSEVLSTEIYRTLTRYGDVGISSATAVLFTLGLMLFSAVVFKVIARSNAQTGVK